MNIFRRLKSEPRNSLINTVKRIHFVGILGVSMSGIAEVMCNQGYIVSGSDIKSGPVANRLSKLGIKVSIGHHDKNIDNAQLLVVSSAISEQNPEYTAAQQRKIPIVPRAHIIAEMMRDSYGIAVAGTHGKTTTTSLLTHIFITAGLQPSYIIGGRFMNSDTNAKLGKGEYLLAEADESDGSFLQLLPCVSIITNIDDDHLETYNNDMQCLRESFKQFVAKLPFYGVAVVCSDDDNLAKIIPELSRRVITYGSAETCDTQLLEYTQSNDKSNILIKIADKTEALQVCLVGRHNVLNSLAVISVAKLIGIDWEIIKKGLQSFPGVKRRFQIHKAVNIKKETVEIIEDYAHHPKEIEATLHAARAYFKDKHLVLVFQPHRYSRTKKLFSEFVRVLRMADQVILTAVYSAGEKHDPDFSAKKLAEAINATYCHDLEMVVDETSNIQKENSAILFFGAGDVNRCIPLLQERCKHNAI